MKRESRMLLRLLSLMSGGTTGNIGRWTSLRGGNKFIVGFEFGFLVGHPGRETFSKWFDL